MKSNIFWRTTDGRMNLFAFVEKPYKIWLQKCAQDISIYGLCVSVQSAERCIAAYDKGIADKAYVCDLSPFARRVVGLRRSVYGLRGAMECDLRSATAGGPHVSLACSPGRPATGGAVWARFATRGRVWAEQQWPSLWRTLGARSPHFPCYLSAHTSSASPSITFARRRGRGRSS
jgi:hypothetical protein